MHSLALDIVAAWAPVARELQDRGGPVQHLVQEILKLVMNDLCNHATTRIAKLHMLRAIHRNGNSLPSAGQAFVGLVSEHSLILTPYSGTAN